MSGQGLSQIPEREDAVKRVKQGESLDLVGRHGKTRLLLELAEELDEPVVVRVPAGPDQGPYVLLHAAAACGTVAMREVASHLATSFGNALDTLDRALGTRPLLVDDADAIGVRGIDIELRHALNDSTERLREFIRRRARVVSTTAPPPESLARTIIPLSLTAPQQHPEVWAKVGHDIDAFELALLRDRLALGDDLQQLWEPAEVVADVWEALPEALQDIVGLLAVHHRPIDEADLQALGVVDWPALDKAVRSGVINSRRGSLWLSNPWYEHCPAVLSRGRTRALRLRLAQAFAAQALGADAYLARPLLVLEAHRHFAGLSDLERAREFAHFGAATLLDTARRLSLGGRYEDRLYAQAAKAYDVVLQLEEQVKSRGGTLGRLIVGYATHYKHYNRYKANLESRVETLQGYSKALESWPENALFHSRMMGALLLDDRYADASSEIARAYQAVPPHSRRDAVLRGRTADKLLLRERVEAALLVWDDYEPDEWGSLTEQRLFDRLKEGFETARLRSFEKMLVLFEPTHVRFTRATKTWLAHALEESAPGTSPAAAYSTLIASVRAEVRRLHRTLTHQLDAADRMKKRRLLGQIDLASSGLLDLGDGTTWVYGRLTDAEGAIELVTDAQRSYVVPAEIFPGATGESAYRLARVRTGAAGEPVGPVVEIGSPLGEDPARAFRCWKDRVANGG